MKPGRAHGARRRWVLALAGLLAPGVGTPVAGPAPGQGGAPAGDTAQALERPNFLVIVYDDLDLLSSAFLPATLRLVRDEGMEFTRAFVSTSLCCPSRTTLLRGQYAHTTRLWTNEPPDGGYAGLGRLGLERSTLATWLHDAGDHTALLGKYVNHYGEHGQVAIPPGWDEWYATVGLDRRGDRQPYFGYFMNSNGTIRRYGWAPGDYHSDVLIHRAADLIARMAREDRPFLIYLAPYAPHTPATPAPRHRQLFSDAIAPRLPNFGRPPRPVGGQASTVPFARGQVRRLDGLYRDRLRSLQAVEEGIASLVDGLSQAGVLDRTDIIVTSDNGYSLGQHARALRKGGPYDEDMQVPLFIRGPGIAAASRFDGLVLNDDLAPTLAELAGVLVPESLDGRSLAPVLHGGALARWRHAILFEHQGIPRDPTNSFRALRMIDSVYIEYSGGRRELFDLRADPYQLWNLVPESDAGVLRALSERLNRLARCAATECRALEDSS